MAAVLMTYLHEDNAGGEVDSAVHELEMAGITVRLSPWEICADRQLWDQVRGFVLEPLQCDAWLVYATVNSLGHEERREEFIDALKRAQEARGEVFPVIALFPRSVQLSLVDPEWTEYIKAAAERRTASISRKAVHPFFIHVTDESVLFLPGFWVKTEGRDFPSKDRVPDLN